MKASKQYTEYTLTVITKGLLGNLLVPLLYRLVDHWACEDAPLMIDAVNQKVGTISSGLITWMTLYGMEVLKLDALFIYERLELW